MPPHIAVLPASTQVGKETIRLLLESAQKPRVRGIYRDPAKAPPDFTSNPDFEAVTGDVAAGTGLDFAGSDAVLYVPPPTWDGTDHDEFATRTATCVAESLRNATGVRRLVIQSALGSQRDPDKLGVLRLNHISDKILADAAPEVVVVRPGYYYHVWAEALRTMREDPPRFESPFSPADWGIPMLSTKDIGAYCATTLLASSVDASKRVVRLFGPRHYSPLDVKAALEEATGRQGEMVVVPREGLAEYWGKRIPEVYVKEFVEFFEAQLPGGVITQDYGDGEDVVRCETELVDELRRMLAEEVV